MGRVLTLVVLVTLVAGATFGAPEPQAKKKPKPDCAARVGNNLFKCAVTPETGDAFTDCMHFATPGQVSSKFEFTSDLLGSTVGCTCDPVGKAAKVTFNRSLSFTCTAAEGVAFKGTVSRNGKLANVSAANLRGLSYAFSCARADACTAQ